MSEPKPTVETPAVSYEADIDGWKPPAASVTSHVLPLASGPVAYRAVADWITLYEDDKPHAAVFCTAYFRDVDDADVAARPLTFFFNGGPGAASAFLHIGAIGPLRVAFGKGGSAPAPPVQLVDNLESWLPFTDLVFVDPIGTGFSRLLPRKEYEKDPEKRKAAHARYWEVQRDLDSLSECVWRFLTRHQRWTSPLFVAGESYGGFRAACLAKHLQETHGIGLNGVYLISPAIELSSLISSDYNILSYCDVFPTMVAAAHQHGKVGEPYQSLALADLLHKAEAFAQDALPALLVQGEAMPQTRRDELLQELAALTGLPLRVVETCQGRLRIESFARELLRDERLVCALHDAALTLPDPFPARPAQEGPDPALSATWWVYTAGINALLRERFAVATEQPYQLFNPDANSAWKDNTRKHFVENSAGAMDEVRYGMALNAALRVMIVHGIHDLVTPYFSSRRLLNQMQLAPSLRTHIQCKEYHGGHMFYGWDESRIAFSQDAKQFYADATPQR